MLPSAAPLPLRWTWLPLARTPGSAAGAAEQAARAWLGRQLGCAAEKVPLRRDARGRPRLADPFSAWDCNWSHSADGLLVALVRGMPVGADLEWVRPRPRALELSRRFFAASETRWLEGLAEIDRTPAFLRLWCAKEAVLKAHGHGISFGLERLVFADTGAGLRMVECDPALGSPDGWSVQELAPAPGYVGAVAGWLHPPAGHG